MLLFYFSFLWFFLCLFLIHLIFPCTAYEHQYLERISLGVMSRVRVRIRSSKRQIRWVNRVQV
jgi:hypothetical protein